MALDPALNLALLTFLALAAVDVGSDTACPAADGVAARLSVLLPAGEAGPTHRAALSAIEGGIEVELRDDQGRLLAQRTLRSASCAELADACAAVLAAWEAELRSQARPLSELEVGRRPILLPRAREPETPALEERPRLQLSLDAGAAASLSGGVVRPGGVLAIGVGREDSRWGGRLSITAAAPFERALGPGRVKWARPALGLGPRLLLWEGTARVEAAAELIAALLYADGVSFDQNQHALDFDPGAQVSVRLAKQLPRWSCWVELAGTAFPRRQTVVVQGLDLGADLPRVALDLRVGVSFGNRASGRNLAPR
ncbi:MAG: hypothetical protein HY901_19685 [Deltaproteobacteria bacterium]|nr:hypothetical protein [Deltaproteobacteria bacterium]